MLASNCFSSAFSSKFLTYSLFLPSADASTSYFNKKVVIIVCERCSFLSPQCSHLYLYLLQWIQSSCSFPLRVCSGSLSPSPSQFFSCRITFPFCQNIPKIFFLLDNSITQTYHLPSLHKETVVGSSSFPASALFLQENSLSEGDSQPKLEGSISTCHFTFSPKLTANWLGSWTPHGLCHPEGHWRPPCPCSRGAFSVLAVIAQWCRTHKPLYFSKNTFFYAFAW